MNDEKDEPRPKLKLAAESSDQEIERYWARHALRGPLRALAANVMRVVRGAGEPYYLGRQCNDVVDVFINYRAAVGAYPSSTEIHEALQLTRPELEATEADWAILRMTRGGLRIAAADLLGQRLQRVQGEKDVMEGFYALERWREEQRKTWEAARRLTEKKKRKPKGSG